MIRATVLRALVLAAAFAAGLTPVTCLGESSNRLPTKATKELPPELLSLLRQKKMPKYSPIFVRLFKEEAELEVWKQDTTGHFQILKTYPICRWSGDVDRKIIVGVGIHQLGRHSIEPLGSLTVALLELRPKIARPPTDRIDLEDLETAGGVLFPDFELRLFLESAHQDR